MQAFGSSVLYDDIGEFAAVIACAQRQRRRHPTSDNAIDPGYWTIRIRCHRGLADVGLLANFDIERQRTQKSHAILLRHALAAALAEDVFGVTAFAADMNAHVLDDAEHRYFDLLEHLKALAGVEQGNVLRCGDDHRAAHRDALRQRKLNVAGAGRQIDDEIIELVPVSLAEQLGECLRHHGPAPDHRRLFVDQIADGHGLNAVRHHRLHRFAIAAFGPLLRTQHAGLAGAVNVGIVFTDGRTFCRLRQRVVDCGGGFTDAALAGRNRDDILDLLHGRRAPLTRVRRDLPSEVDIGVTDTVDGFQPTLERVNPAIAHAGGRVAKHYLHRHATVVDDDIFDRLGGEPILLQIGINKPFQSHLNLQTRNLGHVHPYKSAIRALEDCWKSPFVQPKGPLVYTMVARNTAHQLAYARRAKSPRLCIQKTTQTGKQGSQHGLKRKPVGNYPDHPGM